MPTVDTRFLPLAQRERMPLAMQRAADKLAALVPDDGAARLLRQAMTARTATQRVVWVQRAASAWSAPMAPVAACRKGCAHCCHIPVTITDMEAALIGRAVGRKPVKPAQAVRIDALTDEAAIFAAEERLQAGRRGVPCPFLSDNACSIYAHRPTACRTLLNLDDDALLCELVDGMEVPVPYADARQMKGYFLALQPNSVLADIRAFFPS